MIPSSKPQSGRLQERETIFRRISRKGEPFSAMRKPRRGTLFLVLVPQGLELLLALVFGDLFTPFFLEIAHDDTTFVLFS